VATRLSGTLSKAARSSLVRFVVVGGLSFATDFGSLYLLHGVLGILLAPATVMAFAIAFVVNFGLNRIWAFRASGAVGQQLRRYLYLVAVNLVLTVLIVQGLTLLGLPYLVAKACSTAVLTVGNYFVSRKWIFL
jgi:putative flippase GtrA